MQRVSLAWVTRVHLGSEDAHLLQLRRRFGIASVKNVARTISRVAAAPRTADDSFSSDGALRTRAGSVHSLNTA